MSGRNWSPYDIEVILHHYCSRAPFPLCDAPAYSPCIQRLAELGILSLKANPIGAEPSGIEVTERGRVLIEMWLQTPMPRHVWLDPRDSKEIMEEAGGRLPSLLVGEKHATEVAW